MPLNLVALEEHCPAVGQLEPGDEVDRRALARAVRADEACHLSKRRLERAGVDCDDAAEALRQPSHLESRPCDGLAHAVRGAGSTAGSAGWRSTNRRSG